MKFEEVEDKENFLIIEERVKVMFFSSYMFYK